MLAVLAWVLAAIERLRTMAKTNAAHAAEHDALVTAKDDLDLAISLGEMSETLRIKMYA